MDVLGLTEKGKPARTSRQIGSRHVMSAQHTADNVLIDRDAESQRDLLRNARTAPAGITLLHGHDGVDEVFVGSIRAGATPVSGRKRGTFVGATYSGDATEWKASERWRNAGHALSA